LAQLPPPADPAVSYTAVLDTTAGEIRCELFAADAPQTVGNFVGLARQGFYDGTVFHRIIRDFMVQGGCPEGSGRGGPGYDFPDEINQHRLVRGSLAMANAGPNTNGSQFFLVTADATPWLDGHHTAFGRLVSGEGVLKALGNVPTDRSDRPREEQRLNAVTIEEADAS
jgi:peptidyl-prolyl cis-trans isomerase B (cyclophilin B)